MSAWLRSLFHSSFTVQAEPGARRIQAFTHQAQALVSAHHLPNVFDDVMPSSGGMYAHTFTELGTLAGQLQVPQALAQGCAQMLLEESVDWAGSYQTPLAHSAAQPLQSLLGGLAEEPAIPVFSNAVATLFARVTHHRPICAAAARARRRVPRLQAPLWRYAA